MNEKELEGRMARLEQQRNSALTNEAVVAGQLNAALALIVSLEEKVKELEEDAPATDE